MSNFYKWQKQPRSREKCCAERAPLEAAYDLGSVKTGTGYDAVKEAYTTKTVYHATSAFVVSNAAFTTQARRAARQLGVTLANHAEIAALLKGVAICVCASTV